MASEQAKTGNSEQETMYALIAPLRDERDWRRAGENLDYARRVGDGLAIMLLIAQFAHPASWRPSTGAQG